MYLEHKDLKTKNIENIPIWRYMDLWKFLSLINTSSLFFASVELLGDQFEGKIPDKVFELMKEHERRNSRNDNFVEVFKDFMEDYPRRNTLISSWNVAQHESFALWKMYSKDKLGVAIKTNFDRLKSCFKKTNEEIYIGEVSYFDNEKPEYDFGHFSTLLTKYNYYNFEKEVRCLLRVENEKNPGSRKIQVNLNELIEEVYISPFAYDAGLYEIIEFLKEKHKLSYRIKMSGINDSWL